MREYSQTLWQCYFCEKKKSKIHACIKVKLDDKYTFHMELNSKKLGVLFIIPIFILKQQS